MRGSNGIGSLPRMKTLEALWDATNTELNYQGVRLKILHITQACGLIDQFTAFADQFMGEYRENCWTVPGLASNEDVNMIGKFNL